MGLGRPTDVLRRSARSVRTARRETSSARDSILRGAVDEHDNDIKPDTVEALLETARELLRAEDARAESFLTRGGAAGGFAGIIASLAGGLGAPAIAEDLGRVRWIAGLSLAVGLAALLGSLCIIVVGVLWPRSFETIATSELAQYPTWAFVSQNREMIQGRTLRGIVSSVAQVRARNDARSRWLKIAYVGLLVGVSLIVISAATIGVEKL